jgi:hypothetical protein
VVGACAAHAGHGGSGHAGRRLGCLGCHSRAGCRVTPWDRHVKVYLDDARVTPSGWTRAYWPEDAIALLESGSVTELSLDHDLGDDAHGTGYDVVLWLEEAVATRGFVPPASIVVHSSNSSARVKMALGIASIRRLAAASRSR